MKQKYNELLKTLQKANKQIPNIDQKENIVDTYLCVCNNKIELFRKIIYVSKRTFTDSPLDRIHEIYISMDSKKMALRIGNGEWQPIGTKDEFNNLVYEANCTIEEIGATFDEMRYTLYCNNNIASYEKGYASLKEIKQVLDLANKYYIEKKQPDVKGIQYLLSRNNIRSRIYG